MRYVPLPSPARKAVAVWLEQRSRSSWLAAQDGDPGNLWLGQRGSLTISGVSQVVLAVGEDAGIPGLRPHVLRHTYATGSGRAAPTRSKIRELLGHNSLESTQRYVRAGSAEKAAVVERVFD